MKRRVAIGGGIAVLSIALLFWTGHQFDLFGKKIDFSDRPAFYLFFGSISAGIFGVLCVFMSTRQALKLAVGLWAVFMLVFLAGKASRGEL